MTSESHPTLPRVTTVVIGYNGCDLTLDTFRSLLASDYAMLDHLFVDNGSSDDSVEQVQSAFPTVRIARIFENCGFAGACNVGMQEALRNGSDYVLLLNNDIEVAPDMISRMVEAAEADAQTGLVVPKIYYHDHPQVIWSSGCERTGFPPRVRLLDTPGADDGRYDTLESVEMATLCAALIKREVIEQIGLLDPACYLFWEDYEYTLRVAAHGWINRHVPAAHLWHKVSRTIQEKKPSAWVTQTRARSKAVFARRHPAYASICWPGYRIAAALNLLRKGYPGLIKPYLAGAREGRHAPLPPIPPWAEAEVAKHEVI